ncbi:MAG: Ig-like domain-containing protein [Eubacteriales bacterium]|nr:Ig-like domain-containing protein [Eubacteriales bacterium]
MRKRKFPCLSGIILLMVMCFSMIAYADDHVHQWKFVEVEPTLDNPLAGYEICTICNEKSHEMYSMFGVTIDGPVQAGHSVSLYERFKNLNATAWKSSDTSIAVIDKAGKLTAKKPGHVSIIILVREEDGKTVRGEVGVTVQKGPVRTKMITAPRSITLKKGKSKKLDVKLSPITSTEKITYKISNKKIAAVNKKGVVKAKKKGTAKIQIKSGRITFTVKVKVK